MICPISQQSPSEERFNVITHALGVVLSLVGLGVLASVSAPSGFGTWLIALVYGLSLTQLFTISTLYHYHATSFIKMKFRIWDHCGIFILIAGSYTPFMALGLGGWKGWGMLVLVWTLAFCGIRYKCRHANPFGFRSVLFYLGMGWCVLLVLPQLIATLSTGALAWLVAGGVAYTLGVPFYAWESLRYSHGVWHLFVLAGAACHYAAVVFYVL